jgi:hypothetical protein
MAETTEVFTAHQANTVNESTQNVVVLSSQSTPEKVESVQSEVSLKARKINLEDLKFDEMSSQMSSVLQSASKVYKINNNDSDTDDDASDN